MRFFGAALLLSALLFNWFGYRLVIHVFETQASSDLETQLDENRFDESQLVSVKVPVRYLPYYANSSEFQRVTGQIEIGGVQYKYVKRRIFHDSLELICIPDHAGIRLRAAENEFFKFSYDLAHGKKAGENSHAHKHFSIDNYTFQTAARLSAPQRIMTPLPAYPITSLPHQLHNPVEQPPEMA